MADFDLTACVRVREAEAAGDEPDPEDVKTCRNTIDILEEVRGIFLSKVIPLPVPLPVRVRPEISLGDPSPQPSRFGLGNVQSFLVGELVLDELKSESHSGPVFRAIKESGAHIDIVKQLISDLGNAQEVLQQELKELQRQ